MSRRLSENYFNCFEYICTNNKLKLKREHKRGPLFDDTDIINQYEEIIFDKYHFVIRRQSDSDCYALLEDGVIVKIYNIVTKSSQHINLICKHPDNTHV